jgi:hypothetical protein
MWWLPLGAEDGGAGVAQVALNIVGPAGLIAAFVSLLKLKPDANSQAVVQAQGAAAEWKKLYDSAKVDIEYWRTRAMAGEGLASDLAKTAEDYQRIEAVRNIKVPKKIPEPSD